MILYSVFLNGGCQYFFNENRAKYLITVHMEVTVYIEINLDWKYVNRTVTFSMQNYVRKALHKFQHNHMV